MSNKEGTVTPLVLVEASAKGWRLFRNSRGVAWVGRKAGDTVSKKGTKGIVLEGARRVTFGLTEGASDLIGWATVRITADMVGRTLAQFAAVEVKTEAYQDLTADQINFLRNVQAAGGLALVARQDGEKVKTEEFNE